MQPLKRRLPFLGLILLHHLATAQEVTRPFSAQDAIDTVAIQQTINLYAIAADQKRFDVLPQIFTSDVTVNFNTPGVPVLHGLDAVTSFMSSALRDVVSYHVQSTHYVNLSNTPSPNATTYNSATFFSASERGTQVVTRLGRLVGE